MFQKIYSKMHYVSCTNTHHDVTDLVNHGMTPWEWNITFLWNKIIQNLCLRWHILKSYHFVVEVTFKCHSFAKTWTLLMKIHLLILLKDDWWCACFTLFRSCKWWLKWIGRQICSKKTGTYILILYLQFFWLFNFWLCYICNKGNLSSIFQKIQLDHSRDCIFKQIIWLFCLFLILINLGMVDAWNKKIIF